MTLKEKAVRAIWAAWVVAIILCVVSMVVLAILVAAKVGMAGGFWFAGPSATATSILPGMTMFQKAVLFLLSIIAVTSIFK